MPAQPNQSLIHGLTVLEALAAAGRPVGTVELAKDLGLETTRVNRLLGTLADLGIAERVAGRKYRAGGGLHVLAALALAGSPLLRASLGEIRDLADLGLSVALGVRWRDQVCYLWHGKPGKAIEDGIAGHRLFPVAESSLGVVLSTWATDADLRARGWAHLRADSASASLAVPIGDPPYAALGVAGPVPSDHAEAIAQRLAAAANRIAQRCTPLHGKGADA